MQNDTFFFFLRAPNSSLLAVTANPITEQNNKTDIGGALTGWQKEGAFKDYMKICRVGYNMRLQGGSFSLGMPQYKHATMRGALGGWICA